ncbi:protein phosphatase 1 regulatory subunit 3A [Etheostoma spectabile]|uniref:protein phosphatase 1 regulatory subunit 3A n=1 Tax=Etheostoma spectabile TaxID=54343 RepID=UPI0013AF86F3|nr:protein phosphatase 1 regulatory subunit 3A [Etheostoma spectabile]
MSSVTRFHLLSQSMFNVSCQKQKHCSSLPADSPTGSPMESVGQARPSGACNLLEVPGLNSLDVDDDEHEVVNGIRPKSSPLPRRKSSVSDEDSEPEPPLSGSRRVSFADAKGLSLVHVKEFDTWDVPKLPVCDSSEGKGRDAEEYFLSPLTFSLPLSNKELFFKVREQKLELEAIELLPGTTILKGVIRVLNISFDKAVYVRTTLDSWSSHFDLLAEYMPGSSDSLMDGFSFKLTLVPPFGEQGVRVDFCLRYETPVGTFWANNNERNYVLFCHQRVKERKEKPQKEHVNKKGCLKTFSQNFPTVENMSAAEDSSEKNISQDVSQHGEEADAMKAKQTPDCQSGSSEEDQKKILTENRLNCSQRRCRKAARLARMRDYFSQTNDGADDSERDESPPEAKQAAQEETPEEQHSDVRSFPEGSSKSEGSHFVSESLETCSKPHLDVQQDTSPAHNCTSNNETEESESINLADSATLTGGESVTDILDNPSNDELAPAECQNINKSFSNAEECDIAAEPADRVISAVISESLVSQTNSFTFGTVVAPLYHQVFGRLESERDQANPVRATLNSGIVTQSYTHTENAVTSSTVHTDAKDDDVQGNGTETQEPNKECLDATTNSTAVEEEETNLSMTAANNIMHHAETLQDPDDVIHSDQRRTNTPEVPKAISGERVIDVHAVNILNTHLLNPQIPTENLHLRGEAQEDNLTHELPDHTCAQTKTNLDVTLAHSETQEVLISQESSFMSLQLSQSVSECVSDDDNDDVGKTATISSTNAITEEDKAFHDVNPDHINNSATKGTDNSYVSSFEIVEEKNVTTTQISFETYNVGEGYKLVKNLHKDETKHSAEMNVIGEVAESMTKATMSNHIHGDTFLEPKNEDTQKIEHLEMEAAVAKQENLCFADTAEVNYEMIVEEEEKNILTEEKESEALSLKTENKAEDADVFEGEHKTGEEDIGKIVAGKNREEVVKDLDCVQDIKTAGEEEVAEEIQVEKREEQEETELEKEKHFGEMQEVNIEKTNVRDEEEIEEEEEMEIDLTNDNEASLEWEDEVKPREQNVEEENPDYKEEILVAETGGSEIVDAESETMIIDRGNEVGCFEERLDSTQNKVEDGLSALVNNVQRKRVIDKEHDGHIPTEMHLYKEEDFQTNKNVTHDLSQDARYESEIVAAEGGSCIFTDEPKSNPTSHDSASAESDSDDEVELYMRCLRAVHSGPPAQKDMNKDTGFSAGKRPSISRSKLLSTPMPSICESLDEEQHLSHLKDNNEDTQHTTAALPASSGQESSNRNVSWWKETISCSNISKTLLCATLLMVFLVVAYRYDFLACFGLYLISVVWLYCQRERRPEQQKQQQNRLN